MFSLLLSAAPARAQWGWGGWGGGASTLQGDEARGMGAYAVGAGVYNKQTAEARSINSQTYMQMNEYLAACNSANARDHYALLAKNRREVNMTAAATYDRLHNHPSTLDVRTGDALNVVLDELTSPAVYSVIVRKGNQPIPSQLVRNIEFQYAANMIVISLEDLSANGVPDILLTTPEFEPDRKALKALFTKAKEECHSQGNVSAETLAKCREAITTVKNKADNMFAQGTPNRLESDNYLKALYGLTKMLKTPDVGSYLLELKNVSTTELGKLISFMHFFNLRFGPSKTPQQQAAYEQLYPMLLALRDQLEVPSQNPLTSATPRPNPKAAKQFFSGMDYSQVGAQPPAPTPPPAPGQP